MPITPPPENRLSLETSPYLLQHADNPVHWRGWGPDALAEAAESDKPILLSIGYAACHWCHVMAHESFENAEIAAQMNDQFVNIKVDREERPDLDAIYQQALALLGEQGGWPLTMFCTPKGKPFWGGTYFPPEPRYGRPGFPQILSHISGIYTDERDKVVNNTSAILDALARLSNAEHGGPLGPRIVEEAASVFANEIDRELGGFGGAPKFPHTPVFRLMWHGAVRSGDNDIGNAVTVTLDRMAQGGIYDHLGGGFARYSTDTAWLAPHFEKMLYDNAQLVELYTEAWQHTHNPLYEQRVTETCNWLLTDMQGIAAFDCESLTIDCGGFYSTLDADSEGVEGKYYVWAEPEIDTLLGDRSDEFKHAYDVTASGNWEGTTILNRSDDPELKDEAIEARLSAARTILLEARHKRVPPALDDKILADWNGLSIAALARASLAFDRTDWQHAAQSAYDFVQLRMQADDQGEIRLRHSWRNGEARHVASLDDYAQMARAALLLHEATGNDKLIGNARHWVDILDRHYWAEGIGGYFFTADDAQDVICRTRNAQDNATPSGNGTMVEVLARLYLLTGEPHYRDRADALIAAFSGEVSKNAFPYATLIANATLLTEAVQLVVIGRRGEPATENMLRAAFSSFTPVLVLQVIDPDTTLPQSHPATGKRPHDGKPTAYVCVGPTCSLPVTEPTALAAALAQAV